MKKRFLSFTFLFITAAMLFSACGPAEDLGEATQELTAAVETEAVESEVPVPVTGETQTAPSGGPEPTATAGGTEAGATPEDQEGTTGTPRATVQAGTGGQIPFNDYHFISQLLFFTVEDANETPIGDVNDMILNVCEARIDYLVVGPDTGLELPLGQSMVIPFQAVNHSIPAAGSDENSSQNEGTGTPEAGTTPEAAGTPDGSTGQIPGVNRRTFILEDEITSDVVINSPLFTGTIDFVNEGWDDEVSTYWEGVLGEEVTTECTGEGGAQAQTTPAGTEGEATPEPVTAEPGGTVTGEAGVNLLISANELTGVQLLDLNREPIGRVVNAILDNELDRIEYILVVPDEEQQPARGEYMVVPAGAFSVEYETNDWRRPGLFLLVETNILTGAPTLNLSGLDLSNPEWDAELQGYWSSQLGTENP